MSAAGSRPRPRRWASRSIRASPPPRCSTTTTARCAGVATGDMGIGKDGEPKAGFTRGMELRAKYTLFAEGARGSLTKTLIARFELDEGPRAAEIRHRPEGAVAGRAREAPAGPGAALVRLAARQHAPAAARSSITSTTTWCRSASSCISTTRTRISRRSTNSSASRRIRWCATRSRAASASPTARAPSPKAATSRCRSSTFPGGALIGCAAGFVNVPRIKGSHNAMLSGMLAAEHVAAALAAGRANDELAGYEDAWRGSRDRHATSGRCATSSRCGRASAPSSASRSAASTCGPTRSASRCSAR